MKSCPKCKRTYADDGFTFCLEDGALLSPPHDAKSDEPPTTKREVPPPTAVMPANEAARQELPPTLISTPPPKNIQDASPPIPVPTESQRSSAKYVVIGLVVLVMVGAGLGFMGLYVAGNSNCPRLMINCSPLGATTYCDVAEDKAPRTFNDLEAKPISAALCSRTIFLLQEAALPDGVTEVSWSTSLGTPRWIKQRQLIIDTSKLAGKTIDVKAKVTSSSWFCSTTVSTSFTVPSTPST
jgi:hypothetical protein